MALKVLSQMAERRMPLSPAMCRLIGNEALAKFQENRLSEWDVQRRMSRKTARKLEADLLEEETASLAPSDPPSELPSRCASVLPSHCASPREAWNP